MTGLIKISVSCDVTDTLSLVSDDSDLSAFVYRFKQTISFNISSNTCPATQNQVPQAIFFFNHLMLKMNGI
jgi:hypothetical protein